MQRFKTVRTFIIVALFAVLFTACTDPGSVGGGIAGPETDIKFDTLKITSLTVDTLVAYSGNLDFFSAGQFKDPLFGNISVTGIFKPLLASNGEDDTLAIDDNTQITLNLVVTDTTYGDTLAAQKFKLYEAKELWRGNAWRIKNQIQRGSIPLATFTIGNNVSLINEDTVKIPMPDRWVEKYAKYFNLTENNRDSSYVREFFGLVMVPEGYNKIVTLNPFTTTFLATNVDVIPDTTSVDTTRLDSLSFGLREWAYSVKRTNINPKSQSSSKLISTFERVIRFDFDFTFDDIESFKIARVEVIFYVDKLLLKQSINKAGPSAVRPPSKILNLHYVEGDELPQSVSSNTSLAQAEFNQEDQAYHFNVTAPVLRGFFSRTSKERVFYLTIGRNEGIIRSGLIFNAITKGKAPKVIVTYVETEN